MGNCYRKLNNPKLRQIRNNISEVSKMNQDNMGEKVQQSMPIESTISTVNTFTSNLSLPVNPDKNSNSQVSTIIREEDKLKMLIEVRVPIENSYEESLIVNKDSLTLCWKEIFCCVCLKLFCDPVCCPKCEKHFCLNCIVKWNRAVCPHCKAVMEPRKAQLLLKSLLGAIMFKCINHSHGCTALLGYDFVESHTNKCEFRNVKCKYCNTGFLFQERDDHLYDCELVEINCEKCTMKIKIKQRANHDELSCLTYKYQALENSNKRLKVEAVSQAKQMESLTKYQQNLKTQIQNLKNENNTLMTKSCILIDKNINLQNEATNLRKELHLPARKSTLTDKNTNLW